MPSKGGIPCLLTVDRELVGRIKPDREKGELTNDESVDTGEGLKHWYWY